MKKISRLYGISLALCGLICFSSCDKDETETLAAPTSLTASSVTSNSAVLSWTSDATSFEIKVGDATYTSNINSYSLGNLSPNTTYSWSVKAVKGDISSEWASSSFTTDEVPDVTPEAPTDLVVSNIDRNTADFSWTGDATAYELQWGGNEFNDPVVVTATSYTTENLLPGKLYSWRVRAKNGELVSEWADGEPFLTTPNPSAVGAQVRFGNQTWSPAVYGALVDFEDPYIGVELYSSDPNEWRSEPEYPFLQFFVAGNTTGEYSETTGYEPSYDYEVDYYHQDYIDIGELFELGYSYIIGDYEIDADFPSSIEITAINASTISGTVNLTLYNIPAYLADETINNVPLTVYFFNLPVTDYASLSVPVPGSASSSVQSNPVLKPGKYPIKVGKNTREKIKALKAKTK
jgi:hypothetical protein